MTITSDSAERKAMPIASGVLDFFPDALLEVARVSLAATQQHHPGQAMHWDKSKSTDEADSLMRHLIERGTLDIDGMRHTAKVAWRALALLQRELEAEKGIVFDDVLQVKDAVDRMAARVTERDGEHRIRVLQEIAQDRADLSDEELHTAYQDALARVEERTDREDGRG